MRRKSTASETFIEASVILRLPLTVLYREKITPRFMKQSVRLTGLGSKAFQECFIGLNALQELMKTSPYCNDIHLGWDIDARVGYGFPAMYFQNRLFSLISETGGDPRVSLHPVIDPTGEMQKVWEGDTFMHVQDNVVEYYEKTEEKQGGRSK